MSLRSGVPGFSAKPTSSQALTRRPIPRPALVSSDLGHAPIGHHRFEVRNVEAPQDETRAAGHCDHFGHRKVCSGPKAESNELLPPRDEQVGVCVGRDLVGPERVPIVDLDQRRLAGREHAEVDSMAGRGGTAGGIARCPALERTLRRPWTNLGSRLVDGVTPGKCLKLSSTTGAAICRTPSAMSSSRAVVRRRSSVARRATSTPWMTAASHHGMRPTQPWRRIAPASQRARGRSMRTPRRRSWLMSRAGL